MLPRNHPDRIQITFDEGLVYAGLLLPATLARHLGLPELVRQRLDLGDAQGPEHERQDDDAGGRWLGATALTTPMCCAPGGRPAPWAAR